jgi:hypothetical protein
MKRKNRSLDLLPEGTKQFYLHALSVLRRSGTPFLIGGAYACGCYTGLVRHTKDLDVFVRPADAPRALAALAAAGYRTETTFAHWLGKAFHVDDFIDIIYSSGNGLCPVDDAWFAHAAAGKVLGAPVGLCPPEEMIWQKAYIMERERYDGADVAHLLRACGPDLDWERLLGRFGEHWRILFCHLALFGFIYPSEKDRIPADVLRRLAERLAREAPDDGGARVCQGTLLSRIQYLRDTEQEGYDDARLRPRGAMSPEEAAAFTDAGLSP